jgi:hypothetical protein
MRDLRQRQTWNHVLEQHAELADHLEEIMATVHAPQHREPDVRAGRQRFYRHCPPLGWLRVVTELAGDVDDVVTAFPQSNDPRAGTRR